MHCGTKQTRLKARPAPDFTKLHNQWSEQCKQRKASKKPCTQVKLLDVLTVIPSDHSFMKRPVHPSLGRVKTNMDGQKCGWTG